MVARVPDSDAIMPGRIFRSRANQVAAEPESELMMQLFGRRGDNSQKTRCGFNGLASFIARASRTFHHSTTPLSIFLRHARSFLTFNIGNNARNVSALSPARQTSAG